MANVISAPAVLNGAFTLANGQSANFSNFESVVAIPCFCQGTLIETDKGAVPVEKLGKGDLVLTRDHGYKPIQWISMRRLDLIDLSQNTKMYPIRIKAGALGENTPQQDLLVSPQHRVVIRSKIVQRMLETSEVLVPAKSLLELDGVEVAYDMKNVEYYHFLFDAHEIVFSNALETESLYTGKDKP